MENLIRVSLEKTSLAKPTGRYEHFVDRCLPCLNETVGRQFFRAIHARGHAGVTINFNVATLVRGKIRSYKAV
jgi:hypothetical protein